MRSLLAAASSATLMLCASCVRLADEPVGREDIPKATKEFLPVATTKFSNAKALSIIVSRKTRCQYVWVKGAEAGVLVERLDHGRRMCGAMKTPAFEMLSHTSLGQLDLYVVRDIGTGCRWIRSDGDGAVDLDPETDAVNQICDDAAGRRITPPPAPPADDD